MDICTVTSIQSPLHNCTVTHAHSPLHNRTVAIVQPQLHTCTVTPAQSPLHNHKCTIAQSRLYKQACRQTCKQACKRACRQALACKQIPIRKRGCTLLRSTQQIRPQPILAVTGSVVCSQYGNSHNTVTIVQSHLHNSTVPVARLYCRYVSSCVQSQLHKCTVTIAKLSNDKCFSSFPVSCFPVFHVLLFS